MEAPPRPPLREAAPPQVMTACFASSSPSRRSYPLRLSHLRKSQLATAASTPESAPISSSPSTRSARAHRSRCRSASGARRARHDESPASPPPVLAATPLLPSPVSARGGYEGLRVGGRCDRLGRRRYRQPLPPWGRSINSEDFEGTSRKIESSCDASKASKTDVLVEALKGTEIPYVQLSTSEKQKHRFGAARSTPAIITVVVVCFLDDDSKEGWGAQCLSMADGVEEVVVLYCIDRVPGGGG